MHKLRKGEKTKNRLLSGHVHSCSNVLIFLITQFKIVHFRAFRFGWYMYKKKAKVYLFLSAKGAEGVGGQGLADGGSGLSGHVR